MGSAVSNGALATYEAPNGAGLVIARNGARPVAVGPYSVVNTEPIGLPAGHGSHQHRSPETFGNTVGP